MNSLPLNRSHPLKLLDLPQDPAPDPLALHIPLREQFIGPAGGCSLAPSPCCLITRLAQVQISRSEINVSALPAPDQLCPPGFVDEGVPVSL